MRQKALSISVAGGRVVLERSKAMWGRLSCFVKLTFSLFLQSPQNLNQRMDVFYLQPECSSSADSPVWYTSTSLDRNTLENMLVRVLLVKDIYDKDNYELDEDTD